MPGRRPHEPSQSGRVWLAGLALVVTGCAGDTGEPTTGHRPTDAPSATATPGKQQPAPGSPTATVQSPPADPDAVSLRTAVSTVRHLAGTIGPRTATGPEYQRAARWVARQLGRIGYDVRRQRFHVPAGNSWGVPVYAGESVNLIAAAPGFDPAKPHLVVGAHLDTVPQAPGAEDNASGVGVLLTAAGAVSERRTRLPVVFVVFGAEEPRGPSDDDHHYGSRHYVAQLRPAQRRAVRGMLALDRVGVGDVLPVCSAGNAPDPGRDRVLAAARRAAVRADSCDANRSSDHWSFVRNGLPGVRLGSTPYAGYHSSGDVPGVVNRAQLERAARTTVSWLSPRP